MSTRPKATNAFFKGMKLNSPEFRQLLGDMCEVVDMFRKMEVSGAITMDKGSGHVHLSVPFNQKYVHRMLVKVTGNDSSQPWRFKFDEHRRINEDDSRDSKQSSGTDFTEKNDVGILETDFTGHWLTEINGNFIPDDTVVEVWAEANHSSSATSGEGFYWTCSYTNASVGVLVRKTSGAAGSCGTTATWVYSIWHELDDPASDTALATGLSPECRQEEIALDQAPNDSYGIAIQVPDGAGASEWKLLWVCEIPDELVIDEVVTQLTVSGVLFRKKTRKIVVPCGETESGWTTWHTGGNCT